MISNTVEIALPFPHTYNGTTTKANTWHAVTRAHYDELVRLGWPVIVKPVERSTNHATRSITERSTTPVVRK